MEAIQNAKNKDEPRSLKVVENLKSDPAKNEEVYPEKNDELKQVKDVEEAKLKLDIEELRSKINAMNSKLIEVSIASWYMNLGLWMYF